MGCWRYLEIMNRGTKTARKSHDRNGEYRLPLTQSTTQKGHPTSRSWLQDSAAVATSVPALIILMAAGGIVTFLAVPIASLARTYAPWVTAQTAVGLSLSIFVLVVLRVKRYRGLLRISMGDVLLGLLLGVLLRIVAGVIGGSDTVAFPTLSSTLGETSGHTWLLQLLAIGILGPIVEEFFFHGVLLVAMFHVLAARTGRGAAAFVGITVTAALFALMHVYLNYFGGLDTAQTFLLAIVCGLMVIFSGRIWGAVVIHGVYNLSFVALAAAGSYFSG